MGRSRQTFCQAERITWREERWTYDGEESQQEMALDSMARPSPYSVQIRSIGPT